MEPPDSFPNLQMPTSERKYPPGCLRGAAVSSSPSLTADSDVNSRTQTFPLNGPIKLLFSLLLSAGCCLIAPTSLFLLFPASMKPLYNQDSNLSTSCCPVCPRGLISQGCSAPPHPRLLPSPSGCTPSRCSWRSRGAHFVPFKDQPVSVIRLIRLIRLNGEYSTADVIRSSSTSFIIRLHTDKHACFDESTLL